MDVQFVVTTILSAIFFGALFSALDYRNRWKKLMQTHTHLIDRVHYFRTIVNRQSVELNHARLCAKCKKCDNLTCGDRNERT